MSLAPIQKLLSPLAFALDFSSSLVSFVFGSARYAPGRSWLQWILASCHVCVYKRGQIIYRTNHSLRVKYKSAYLVHNHVEAAPFGLEPPLVALATGLPAVVPDPSALLALVPPGGTHRGTGEPVFPAADPAGLLAEVLDLWILATALGGLGLAARPAKLVETLI